MPVELLFQPPLIRDERVGNHSLQCVTIWSGVKRVAWTAMRPQPNYFRLWPVATFRCNAMTFRFRGNADFRVWFARIYEFTALTEKPFYQRQQIN